MNWHAILHNFLGWLLAFIFYYGGTRLVIPYIKYFALAPKEVASCAECKKRDDYMCYTFLANRFFEKIPFLGKYMIAFLASFWFASILKKGEQVWQRKMTNRNALSVTPKL